MGKLDVVCGIERFGGVFSANGIECDNCGEVLTPRYDNFKPYQYGLDRVQVAAIVDHDWNHLNGEDLCPKCTKLALKQINEL